MIKSAIWVAVIVFLLFVGYRLYRFAFGGGKDAELSADGIHVFKTPKDAQQRYPFVGCEFTGVSGDELTKGYSPNPKPSEFEDLARVRFSAVRPVEAVSADYLREVNEVRQKNGQKAIDPAALNRTALYTIRMDLNIGRDVIAAYPDVWFYNKSAEGWKGVRNTVLSFATAKIDPDPIDPHKFQFGGASFQFNDDYTQLSSSGSLKTALTRADKLPALGLSGYWRAHMKLVATTQPTPRTSYEFYRQSHMIEATVPLFMKAGPDGQQVGKALIDDQTKAVYGFRDPSGTVKLFIPNSVIFAAAKSQDDFIEFNSSRPTTSIITFQSQYLSYVTTLEKPNLGGKEADMAANYDSLGSVPETVKGVPQVWNYYDEVPRIDVTLADVANDATWSELFGVRRGHDDPTALAIDKFNRNAFSPLRVPSTAGARPESSLGFSSPVVNSPTAQPANSKPLTDEEKMQEAYRKRHGGQ